jgi:phytoene/squalene synthetase
MIRKQSLTLFNKTFIASSSKHKNGGVEKDLGRAIQLVQKYDPVGYLPGLLVTDKAKIGYFAGKFIVAAGTYYYHHFRFSTHVIKYTLVRAFWIDSGLRFVEENAKNEITASKQIEGVGEKGIAIPDDERLEKWRNGINSLFDGRSNEWEHDPTLRLLKIVLEEHRLSKTHFENILKGREIDVNSTQYETIDCLKNHVELSCGSLLNLVLECASITHEDEENEVIFNAAKHIGIAHGLTNALRLSIPKASSTGKVIIPQDLCEKHNIRSPRYLLNALGMGDEQCKRNLQGAVKEIVSITHDHLSKARIYHDEIIHHPRGKYALSTFLPALASETFLNRLENHQFDLTNRKLRDVGMMEHVSCTYRILIALIQNRF